MEYSLEEWSAMLVEKKIGREMAKVPSVEEVSIRSLVPSFSLPPTIPTDNIVDNYANGLISSVVQREAKRIAMETEEKLREAYDRGFADGFGSATGANRAISEGAL
jgi:hypothetical protein